MDNHRFLSYNPPRVDGVWQHDLETVGCTGPMKSVGVAAEGKGVLVLRYSKGTKDTSTTASPTETHWEGGHSTSMLHSLSQKCCALPYENTVVPLQYVDGASTARKTPKRNK